VGPHGAPSLAPRGPLGLRLALRFLLSMKTSIVFFFEFISEVFGNKKDRKRFSAKNNISFGSFYPSVGSILDKTSSKVIGKDNLCEMHHLPQT
jgi:hypothetical protein